MRIFGYSPSATPITRWKRFWHGYRNMLSPPWPMCDRRRTAVSALTSTATCSPPPSRRCGIRYSHLGRELGGRSDDPACYEGGQIQYELVARTSVFREGLARVVGGAANWRVALMCAEKEPLDCHRTLLVARALVAAGVDVVHILADGELETHERTMDRLLAELSPNYDLFQPREELLARAIALQARRIAFVSKDSDTNSRSRRGHSVTPTTMKAGAQGPPAGDDSPRSRRGHSVTPTTMKAGAQGPPAGDDSPRRQSK